ncbi:DgyrCDS3512 [Dimorphilus gyrociliatus]|uniref:DgyrCDS3512 n=1 Tax=Dimorphilus gyrociliatus TaxID=2664684 RepID=A0A7I8VG58_9ANNE|nr:DgyrCDS3512 [Dimorphilus gyrociliatus]
MLNYSIYFNPSILEKLCIDVVVVHPLSVLDNYERILNLPKNSSVFMDNAIVQFIPTGKDSNQQGLMAIFPICTLPSAFLPFGLNITNYLEAFVDLLIKLNIKSYAIIIDDTKEGDCIQMEFNKILIRKDWLFDQSKYVKLDPFIENSPSSKFQSKEALKDLINSSFEIIIFLSNSNILEIKDYSKRWLIGYNLLFGSSHLYEYVRYGKNDYLNESHDSETELIILLPWKKILSKELNFKYDFEILPRHWTTFYNDQLSYNKDIESIRLHMSENVKQLDFILAPFFFSNGIEENFVLSKPIFHTCLAMLVKDGLYLSSLIQSIHMLPYKDLLIFGSLAIMFFTLSLHLSKCVAASAHKSIWDGKIWDLPINVTLRCGALMLSIRYKNEAIIYENVTFGKVASNFLEDRYTVKNGKVPVLLHTLEALRYLAKDFKGNCMGRVVRIDYPKRPISFAFRKGHPFRAKFDDAILIKRKSIDKIIRKWIPPVCENTLEDDSRIVDSIPSNGEKLTNLILLDVIKINIRLKKEHLERKILKRSLHCFPSLFSLGNQMEPEEPQEEQFVEVEANIKTLTISKHYDGYTGTSRILTLEDDPFRKEELNGLENSKNERKKRKREKSPLNMTDTDSQQETLPQD